jgi:hypothetical protein
MLVERRGTFGPTVPTSQLGDGQSKEEVTLEEVEDHHLEVVMAARITMGREEGLSES